MLYLIVIRRLTIAENEGVECIFSEKRKVIYNKELQNRYLRKPNLIVMRKVLLFVFAIAIAATSCKKDDTPSKSPEEVYAERLNGNWNVNQLTYTATVSTPFGPVPINGTATNSGNITFNSAAKTASYNIKFLPQLGNLPIPIDTVRLEGNGTFTNTTTAITLTESSGQTLIFNVVTNEASIQVLRTAVNYQVDSATVVPVTLEMRLGR